MSGCPRPCGHVQRQPLLRSGRSACGLADGRSRSLIYHRSMAPLVAAAVGTGPRLLIEVDDDRGGAGIAGSVAYEEAIAAQRVDVRLPTPWPDDLYLVCTGGTTGGAERGGVARKPTSSYRVWAAARTAPRTAWWGGDPGNRDVVRRVAPHACRRPVDRVRLPARRRHGRPARRSPSVRRREHHRDRVAERVNLMSIVGDAYARPLVAALEQSDGPLVAARHRNRWGDHE